jgi:DNA-binding NarL/FixJ family response regulator
MKKLLIIDDHTMFRQALLAILKESLDPAHFSYDDANSAESAMQLLIASHYDMVILDIAMPRINGIEFLPQLKARFPDLPVLMLSMYPEEEFALQALRVGASGYITKQEASEELLAAIDAILKGNRYLSRSFSSKIAEQILMQGKVEFTPHLQLSRRELDVLRRLSMGQNLKNIAEDLGLSIKTISTYKTRLCNKMGFKNNVEMIGYALSHSLG